MSALVLGATGNIGPHVVHELIALGQTPRVVVRDADKAHTLFGDAVEVIAGDMSDPAVLDTATDGVDSVFLLSPHSFGMANVQLGVIRELRRSGIRIVKLSGTSSAITPDGPHVCRQHWEIERVLQESGQPFVILRPNSFMQVLVGQLMLGQLRATGSIINAIGQAGISLIDARDVGAVAAQVLTRHDWDGQTLELTGPRAVTYPQLSKLVGVYEPAPVVDAAPAQVRASLLQRGVPGWEAEHFLEMYELFAAGESAFVTDTLEQVTGRPPRTIEAFLAETLEQAGVAS
ncbi:NmrA family NAD(P)-binding protein [Arthrobacter sp. GMC3]|uniref:NmrA family NAD(P)-binding protein n=1 Tax=Arthrobacter sp. GMC3 TaxID=2058894 RepID=UPI0015E2D536|nr:NmrA family NAD(P)-binding protein [Arthrobacter sp. GMC3]